MIGFAGITGAIVQGQRLPDPPPPGVSSNRPLPNSCLNFAARSSTPSRLFVVDRGSDRKRRGLAVPAATLVSDILDAREHREAGEPGDTRLQSSTGNSTPSPSPRRLAQRSSCRCPASVARTVTAARAVDARVDRFVRVWVDACPACGRRRGTGAQREGKPQVSPAAHGTTPRQKIWPAARACEAPVAFTPLFTPSLSAPTSGL